jgi:phospholipid/cholesterol/gamma-HCH transport system substrate-binding protein
MDPGTPQPSLPDRGELHDGDRLPVWNTLPAVNPDEVLAALDTDTRNYLATVADAGGQGLNGRGVDLRRFIQASEPTFAETNRVMRVLADRRTKIARLVTNLRLLAQASASKDTQLASLVSASNSAFSAIAARDAELGAAVDRLPGTLGALNRALTATRGLAGDLKPALAALEPSAQRLAPSLLRVRPLLRQATPLVRTQLRPLVREATPLLQRLRPSVDLVNRSNPDLIRSANVLDYVANELGYNPPGAEEGYLFWLAWFMHNDASILSIEDAQGVAWRGLVVVGCSSFSAALAANPALAPLATAAVCGKTNQGPKAQGKGR